MSNNKAVFGIVRTQHAAETLISALKTKGFQMSDISVLLPNKGETRDFAHVRGTKAPEGAVVGGGTGSVAGGVFGLLVGFGALAIPGLGPLIAAGPIMAALSGMALGAAVGSIGGALIGLGIPEIQAKAYEGKIKGGNILVSVHATEGTQVTTAREAFQMAGAEDISVTREIDVPTTTRPMPSPAPTPKTTRL